MGFVSVCGGVVLVVATLWEVFHDLKFVRGNEVPREEVFARYAAYQEVERAV